MIRAWPTGLPTATVVTALPVSSPAPTSDLANVDLPCCPGGYRIQLLVEDHDPCLAYRPAHRDCSDRAPGLQSGANVRSRQCRSPLLSRRVPDSASRRGP